MKKDIKNIRASIRAKLQNKAKETNRPFAEVLQYKVTRQKALSVRNLRLWSSLVFLIAE